MPISSTPCSCDGLNENCFRCWGTGMVEPKAIPAPTPKVACFTPREYFGDYVPSKSKAKKSRTKGKKPIAHCPHCGVGVHKLEDHLLKAHKIVQFTSNDIRGSTPRTKEPYNAKLKCEKCNLHFSSATQLASHVIGTHGKRVFKKLGYQAPTGTVNTVPERATTAFTERPANLDAQRNWSAVARDHGQFGSHPSHDDMGDESFS